MKEGFDMRRPVLACCVCLILVMLISGPGLAEKRMLSSSSLALITAPDTSESRLLMAFDMPSLVKEHEVYHAEIRFMIPGDAGLTEVELYEISGSWSAGSVGWAGTWKAAGGDIRGDRIDSWITDDKTGDLVKFVVTESASRMMEGEVENHGFVVVCTNEDSDRLVLPNQQPKLTVYTGKRRHSE